MDSLTLPGSKTYKATVFKTVWCWSKDGHVDKENTERCPDICGQAIFNKDDTVI